MIFLAVSVTFAVTLATAAASWMYAPVYYYKVGSGAGSPENDMAAEAQACPKSLNVKKWTAIALPVCLCAAAMWRISGSGAEWTRLVRCGLTAAALVSAAIFDMRTHLIPNFLVAAMLLLGASAHVLTYIFRRGVFTAELLSSLAGLVIGFAVFYLLSRFTKNGMGMGDVKLLSAVGWLTDLSTVLWSTLFALLLCLLPALYLMLTKKKGKSDHIPFGPFVFLGYILLLMLSGG